MPPAIFYFALIGIVIILVGFIIMELARPYPSRKKRREKLKREAKKARRHEEIERRLAEAAIQDELEKDNYVNSMITNNAGTDDITDEEPVE